MLGFSPLGARPLGAGTGAPLPDGTTLTLRATEAPDVAAFRLSVHDPVTPEIPVGGGGVWFGTKGVLKAKDRIYIDERADLRRLILKAHRGESIEADAVVEAVSPFVGQTNPGSEPQIDWLALEAAQGQLTQLINAVTAYEQYLTTQAEMGQVAEMLAQAEEFMRIAREDEEIIALLLAI